MGWLAAPMGFILLVGVIAAVVAIYSWLDKPRRDREMYENHPELLEMEQEAERKKAAGDRQEERT